MLHEIIINNYLLGARLKTSPTHKIVLKERLDKSHTKIVYKDLTQREIQLCEMLFARKLKEVD